MAVRAEDRRVVRPAFSGTSRANWSQSSEQHQLCCGQGRYEARSELNICHSARAAGLIGDGATVSATMAQVQV